MRASTSQINAVVPAAAATVAGSSTSNHPPRPHHAGRRALYVDLALNPDAAINKSRAKMMRKLEIPQDSKLNHHHMFQVAARDQSQEERFNQIETLINGDRIFHYEGEQFLLPRYLYRTYSTAKGRYGWILRIPGVAPICLMDIQEDPLGSLADALILHKRNLPDAKIRTRHRLMQWEMAHKTTPLGVPGATLMETFRKDRSRKGWMVQVQAGKSFQIARRFDLGTPMKEMRAFAREARDELEEAYYKEYGYPLLSVDATGFKRLEPKNAKALDTVRRDPQTRLSELINVPRFLDQKIHDPKALE